MYEEILAKLKRFEQELERLRAFDVGAGGGAGNFHDHDHSASGYEGGSFDAANLGSGAATDGQVLTADGAGGAAFEDAAGGVTVSEGPGIDIVTAGIDKQIGLGGDTVLLYDNGGNPVAEYATPQLACAAAGSGDAVVLFSGTFANDLTVPSGVIVLGMSPKNTFLTGEVTLGDESALVNIAIIRTANDASDLIGVVGPITGTGYLLQSHISVVQNGAGTGYALQTAGGNIIVEGGYLYGSTGTMDADPTSTESFVSTVGAEVGIYCSSSATIPAGWYQVAYDDSLWTATILRTWPYGFDPYAGSQWVTVDNGSHPANSYHLYRREFTLAVSDDISSAILRALGDNYIDYIYINGTLIFSTGSADAEAVVNIDPGNLVTGTNVLAVAVRNRETALSLGYLLEISHGGGRIITSAVRMTSIEGEPARGDKSAWNTVSYPDRHAKDIEDAIYSYHKNPSEPEPAGVIEYSDTDVTNPPTQEEIEASFGAAYTRGTGFVGLLDDTGNGLYEYLVVSDGDSWHYHPLVKARSSLGYGSLTRYGIVLAPGTGEDDYVAEPTVIIEGGLWKMWYRYGWSSFAIAYATSPDGKNWTRYASNPILNNYVCPFVFKDGSVYHLYVAKSDFSQFDHYTSNDGVVWALDTAAILTPGAGGAWDDSLLGNMFVWKEDTNDWRMIYEAMGGSGVWKIGYATSADGNSWSKSGSNPVISETGSRGGPFVYKNGSTYYLWCHGSTSGVLPTDLYRYYSTNLTSWTADGLILARSGADEGEGDAKGQVADPHIVIHNEVMYLFYEGSPDGLNGTGVTNIKLVTAKESLIWE